MNKPGSRVWREAVRPGGDSGRWGGCGGGGAIAFVTAVGRARAGVEPVGAGSAARGRACPGVQAGASPQLPPERVSPRRIRVRRLSAAARVCSQALFLVTPR